MAAAAATAGYADLVGAAQVRDGGPGDAVAGLEPRLVVAPGSAEEAAAVLERANRERHAVVPRGGATMRARGAPPRACSLGLATGRLDRLVEHAAGDLVCTAGAGITLAGLAAELDRDPEHRQMLALDPPQGGAATLGGTVAAAASGPLRQHYGTARDLLLGARFALADGTLAKAGGKVVKNVAGFDVCKLLAGSLGTLAVLVELTVKLHPQPAARRLLVLEGAGAERAAALPGALRAAGVVPESLDVHLPEGVALLTVAGTEAGVEAQAAAAAAAGFQAAPAGEVDRLEAALRRRPWVGEGPVAGLAAPRSRAAALVAACLPQAAELVLRPGLGVAEARLAGVDAATVRGLRCAAEALGGRLVLLRAGPELAAEAWPAPEPAVARLTAAVKQRLDPRGTLSPGRHLGGV